MKNWKKTMGRRFLHLFLSICIVLGCALPGTWTVYAESGNCGTNAKWDLTNGVLTVSGDGPVTLAAWAGYRSKIQSVVIGDGITSLPLRVFANAPNLTSIKLGKSLKATPSGMCEHCDALTTVTFSAGLETITSEAFRNCFRLTDLNLPNTLKTIEDKAFYACVYLKSLTIPDSVTAIGAEAFKATNIKKLELGSGLQTIGKEAFALGCFPTAEIPDSIQSIGEKAFGIVYASVTANDSTINYSYTGSMRKVTIIGKENGVAQQYAQSESLPFQVTGQAEHVHTWSDWKTTTAAGCETTGVETRKCSGCGESETRSTAATGHHMGDWKVDTAATCDQEGQESRTCSGCGKTETRSIPATGHQMSDWTIKTAPDCETEGENIRTCAVCGKQESQTVPATGHNWGEWVITKQPTVDAAGEQQSVCSNCKEVRKMEVAKLIGYTVSVSASEGGTAEPAGETKVAEGGSMTITVKANDGYQLASVLVNGSEMQPDSSGAIKLSDIRANQSVSVVFQKKAQPKTRICNYVDVTPQRNVWLTDESGLSMQDFKIYANISDKGMVSWLEITADCIAEPSALPKSEPYGTGTVTFKYQGSDAEVKEYLAQNSITGQIPLYLRGDTDLDGKVDVIDAELALTYYVKQIAGAANTGFSEEQCTIMDVDSSGKATLEDAVFILKYYTTQMAHRTPDWNVIINQK